MGNAFVRLSFIASVALVACGDDNNKTGRLPDAPPGPDAAIDAAMIDGAIDAAILPVKITIQRDGVGVSDVHVYFQNPDSSLVVDGSVITNATGDAQAVMPLGGFVTAIDPFSTPIAASALTPAGGITNNDLRTFAGAKPGDHLFLNQDTPPGGEATITVTAPNDSSVTYEVNTTCGSGSFSGGNGSGSGAPVGSITLTNCANDTADIVIATRDREAQQIQSAASRFAVPINDETSIEVVGEDLLPTVSATFSYSNARDGSSDLSITHLLRSSRGMFSNPLVDRSGALDAGGAEINENEPMITGVLGVLQTGVTMNAPHTLLNWGPITTRYDVDLSVLLPDVTSDPVFDVENNRVTWSEATDGTTPHLTFATIHVNRVEVRSWDWAIAAPYKQGEIDFPTLPTDIFDWKPTDTDRINRPVQMVNMAVDLTNPEAHGYDAVRAQIHNLAQIGETSAFITTAAGRVIAVATPIVQERPTIAPMLRLQRAPARMMPTRAVTKRVAPASRVVRKRLAPRAH